MTTLRSRPARFEGDDAQLAGELVTPPGVGPFPGLVMLHGASWGEREFYRVFADEFVAAGVASLIFDRRGHGDSSGDRDMDLFRLGRDASTAYRWLEGQPEIDASRAGLWGFSNGAWVATLAAGEVGPAFLMLAGAAGVSPGRAEAFRRAHELQTQGIAPPTVAAVERAWSLIFEVAASGLRPGLEAELRELQPVIESDPDLERLPVPAFVRARPELASVPRFDRPPLNGSLEAMAGVSPDMGFEPMPVIETLRCPVLVVIGSEDANVAPVESVANFREAAARGARVQVEVIEGANHSFTQSRGDGDPDFMTRPPTREEYDPRFLETMVSWLKRMG